MKKSKLLSDIIVPCSAEKHKVRLAAGRFWAAARCPRCRSQVDPTRVRRILALTSGAYRASGATRLERLTVWCVWGYLAAVVLVSIGLRQWGDRWGPMTILLFGPRWLLLVPVVALAIAVVRSRPRLLIPLAVAGVVVTGPLMGFTVGWRRWLDQQGVGNPIRLVTFNVAGGNGLNTSLPWIIEETRADILGFQECSGAVAQVVHALPDVAWHTSVRDQLCLVSRYPITEARQLDRHALQAAGGSGIVIAYTIDLGDRQLHLTNLHLDTPREGLEPVRNGNLAEGFNTLRSKSVVRDIESRQARRLVAADSGAIVVLGDFNLPVESIIYRRNWGDLRNAFSHAGFGFGYTRFAGWIRARIDHILANNEFQIVRAIVGPDFGSDHRPMIADLLLREHN